MSTPMPMMEDANANEGNGNGSTETNTYTNADSSALTPLQAVVGDEGAQSSAMAQDALAYAELATDSNISMEGGRLWQAAAQEAERRGRTMDSNSTGVLPSASQDGTEASGNGGNGNSSSRRHGEGQGPKGPGSRFAETFMERTRSRADPNLLFADPKAKDTASGAPQQMIRISKQDEALFLNGGASGHLPNKRVRVVQLLIIGLVATLLGWLGNFFVGTSCNFASVDVAVGQNSQVFTLHFGLWKYSPADSAFNGYTYCYPYGENHSSDVPIFSRISNLSALLAGTYSLVILWWYLISGNVVKKYWQWAVYMAIFAGVLQLSTLFFFVGRLCRKSACSLGPASIVALVTAVAWLVLAWELAYNMPAVQEHGLKKEEGGGTTSSPAVGVTNLEMADLQGASQEYYERFSPRGQYQPPTIS